MITSSSHDNGYEFRGLSTDIKPVSTPDFPIHNGSIFFEMDTSRVFMYNDDESGDSKVCWYELTSDGFDNNKVIQGLPGPQGPKGEKGDPGDLHGLGIASATRLGGVKAEVKTDKDNLEVKVDPETGKLYTAGEPLTQASADKLGGIKAEQKTDKDVIEVKIDRTTGKLFTSKSGLDLKDGAMPVGYGSVKTKIPLDIANKIIGEQIKGTGTEDFPAIIYKASNIVKFDKSFSFEETKKIFDNLVTTLESPIVFLTGIVGNMLAQEECVKLLCYLNLNMLGLATPEYVDKNVYTLASLDYVLEGMGGLDNLKFYWFSDSCKIVAIPEMAGFETEVLYNAGWVTEADEVKFTGIHSDDPSSNLDDMLLEFVPPNVGDFVFPLLYHEGMSPKGLYTVTAEGNLNKDELIYPKVATETEFGAIKARSATPEDTQEVHITPEGHLMTKPLQNVNNTLFVPDNVSIFEIEPRENENIIQILGSVENPLEVDWGDGTKEIVTNEISHTYTLPSKKMLVTVIGKITDIFILTPFTRISLGENLIQNFGGHFILGQVSKIDRLYTDNATAMASMFLTYLNQSFIEIPYFNTSKVTNMHEMFENCENLMTIPLLNTQNVTNMRRMFNKCTSLMYIPLLNTENVQDMTSMFLDCKSLITIPKLNTSNAIEMNVMFDGCKSLITIPKLDTSNVTSMFNMFCGCESLTALPKLDTSKVTDMSDMLSGCSSLTSIPLLDTSKVTSMYNMFTGCTSLVSIPQLNTSNVEDVSGIFWYCTSLTSIPLLDTVNVQYMNYSFAECNSLKSLPKLNTSKVVNMNFMLSGCKSLTELPELDTSNVTSMKRTFERCKALKTIPLLNTSLVTDMGNIFRECTSLETIPLIDTSSVLNMSNMFRLCSKLTSIPLLNCSKVTDMGSMFKECSLLSEIPALDCTNVTTMNHMFELCPNITVIHIKNINTDLDISSCSKMAKEAIVEVINNLVKQEAGVTKTLTLGTALLTLLTDEDKLIATNKGWTLA